MTRWEGQGRELASVALGTAALLLAEIVLGAIANYVYSDEFNLLMPALVFGPTALGGMLALVKPFDKLDAATVLVGAGLSILISILGIAHLMWLGPLWIALPITVFGIYLCKVMSDVPLRTAVLGLGVGGSLLYLLINGLVGVLGPFMIGLLVTLAVLAAIVRRPTPAMSVVGALVLVATTAVLVTGSANATSFIERDAKGLVGAKTLLPSVYSPLFRTDILQATDGDIVLTTNGSRFAVLPHKGRIRRTLAGEPMAITYEAPYLVGIPKNVLVIGSAEGENVLAGIAHHASVVAVDINPAVFQLLKGPLAKKSGGIYLDKHVTSVVSEGRRYAESSDRQFDLITVQGVQTGSQAGVLNTALLESFLFTEEALSALWSRLTPTGMLYMDEYVRYRDEEAKDVTLMGVLAGSAGSALKLASPERQCIHFTYNQRKENPNRSGRPREAVILTRTPLDDAARDDVRAKLTALGAVVDSAPCTKALSSDARIVDDRPFFLQMVLLHTWQRIPVVPIAVVAAVSLVALVWRARKRPSVAASGAMFLTGVGYIVFVLAISGPATLLLGEPRLTTPVVFVAMYLFGLIGGLVALRLRASLVPLGVGVLTAYLLVLTLALPVLKPLVLRMDSLALRALVVALIMLPAALLAELPYVYLLGKREQGRARGGAFVIENLGTLIGLPIGFACQIAYGFSSGLVVSAAAYALALLVLSQPGSLGAEEVSA